MAHEREAVILFRCYGPVEIPTTVRGRINMGAVFPDNTNGHPSLKKHTYHLSDALWKELEQL